MTDTITRCEWCDEEITSTTRPCEHCGLEQTGAPDPETLPVNPGTCPWCAEDIKPGALVCKHCGRDVHGGNSRSGTNGYAIASLVLSLVSLAGIGSILAIIFGFIARGQIRESRGNQTGNGMAMAGIIIGFIGLIALAIWVVVLIGAANSVDSYSYDY
jgi:hypothetical protein